MDAPLEALIAAVVAFIFISLLFGFLALVCRKPQPKPQFLASRSLHSSAVAASAPFEESDTFDPALDRVSLAELAAATKNFSPESIIGDGTFGFVYKAQLPSGVIAAVKKLSSDAFSPQGLRQFRAEITTLGGLRHPNLARILGFCSSGRDRMLIYEYLEQGSLDSWLHDEEMNCSEPVLAWSVRVKIVKGVAAGLKFLHDECQPPVIHRDIKASNILLDGGFQARIADFGLARQVDGSRSHVSTQAAGTMGYMAPELRDGLMATAKADVYSFGVLMLEIASTKRPSWPVREDGGYEVSLVKWARKRIEEGSLREILDHRMEIGEGKVGEVEGFMAVAYKCTEESAKKRPSMREVVLLLDQLLQEKIN
ncbi:Leucine-rich receptor-like protein kinase family protein [Rhynchospora pubera]|uniref:non-specific serine/threonine protein kinase n=1 Tax=Rhynchospora pubera TaxID=906938 RepID=A0AAV8FVG6_9POAL|nr:Leucine-rich receptor-like protein kinase family protein [Rhynchospora pubera]